MRGWSWVALTVLLGLGSTGCVKKMAMNTLADALSGDAGGAFTQHDDLEFVGDAVPFALKLMESILEGTPEHVGLHVSLASGYTQYGTVWVRWPAQQLRYEDYAAYVAGEERSRLFFARAMDYGMDGLELSHPGFRQALFADRDAALAMLTKDDVSLAYWAAAAWLSKINVSREDVGAIAELPVAGAMVRRLLELDPDWDKGAIHDLLIVVEPSLPEPGGADRAREHFQRAVELNGGSRAGSYVSLATTVSITAQDRDEFQQLLEQALAVDAGASEADELANLYAQEQARFYLDHIDDLFL